MQKLVNIEKSDLYDVLEYVFNGDYVAMTREARAKAAEADIFAALNDKQKEFISFLWNFRNIFIGKKRLKFNNSYQKKHDAA